MKVFVISDIHLEFDDYPYKLPKCDVMLIAGDTVPAERLQHRYNDADSRSIKRRTKRFYENASKAAGVVIEVMGNHSHYAGGLFQDSASLIRDFLSDIPNYHLLDNEHLLIGDYAIFGSTLWTDLNKGDPLTSIVVDNPDKGMNDYYAIDYAVNVQKKEQRTRFKPCDSIREHNVALTNLKYFLDHVYADKKILMTHHAPCPLSIPEKYRHDRDSYVFNGAYASDLTYLMGPPILAWFHGHIHYHCDYEINGTRIFCNARGYPHEKGLIRFQRDLVIEI